LDKLIQLTIEDAGFKIRDMTATHAAGSNLERETYERQRIGRRWLLTTHSDGRFTLQSFRNGMMIESLSYMLSEQEIERACKVSGITVKTEKRDAYKAERAEQAKELQEVKGRIAKMGGEGSGIKGHQGKFAGEMAEAKRKAEDHNKKMMAHFAKRNELDGPKPKSELGRAHNNAGGLHQSAVDHYDQAAEHYAVGREKQGDKHRWAGDKAAEKADDASRMLEKEAPMGLPSRVADKLGFRGEK
jgi:hypothetical protein